MRGLRAAGGEVDRCVVHSAGLQLQVEVQVDLVERRRDARLVEQRAQALVLLGREDDRRRVAAWPRSRRGRAAGRRAARPRTTRGRSRRRLLPRCVTVRCGRLAEVVSAIDRRKLELSRQLSPAGLGRGEHRRLVQQRPRVGSLARRLEVEDDRVVRHVIEKRWPRRVEVGRVELDPGERRARAKARQLVLPFRAHVPAQAVERNRCREAARLLPPRGPGRSAARGRSGSSPRRPA